MKRITKTVATVALVFLAHSAFACDYPERTDVPDGATATKDEMIAGQRNVKSYMAAMEEYLSCIEAEESQAIIALGPDADEAVKLQRIELFNKKYNAAIEEMNLVAEEFNIQVRAYKARND